MVSPNALMSCSLLALVLNCTCPVIQAQPTTAEPATAATTSTSPLSGQVELVEVNLSTLRDLGLDIKRVHHGAAALVDEVSRQPIDIQTVPNVVGFNQIVNIPVGFTGGGYVPPRKAAVDAAMDAMEPWIDIAKASVDAIKEGHKKLDLDDATKQELAPQFKQWESLVNETYNHLQTLKTLTKGPSYDNAAIAEQASAIAKDAKSLDKVRREVYKVLQREGKETHKKSKKNDGKKSKVG